MIASRNSLLKLDNVSPKLKKLSFAYLNNNISALVLIQAVLSTSWLM